MVSDWRRVGEMASDCSCAGAGCRSWRNRREAARGGGCEWNQRPSIAIGESPSPVPGEKESANASEGVSRANLCRASRRHHGCPGPPPPVGGRSGGGGRKRSRPPPYGIAHCPAPMRKSPGGQSAPHPRHVGGPVRPRHRCRSFAPGPLARSGLRRTQSLPALHLAAGPRPLHASPSRYPTLVCTTTSTALLAPAAGRAGRPGRGEEERRRPRRTLTIIHILVYFQSIWMRSVSAGQ